MSIGKIIKIILISIVTIIVIAVLRVMIPFVSSLVTILNNCDNTDYSPIIKKVAVPMQEELETFYTNNKRFPTAEERDEMLEKVGCLINGGVCLFDGDRIKIISQESNYDYYMKFRMERTGCSLYINNVGRKKGQVSRVRCGNRPCINLKQ